MHAVKLEKLSRNWGNKGLYLHTMQLWSSASSSCQFTWSDLRSSSWHAATAPRVAQAPPEVGPIMWLIYVLIVVNSG